MIDETQLQIWNVVKQLIVIVQQQQRLYAEMKVDRDSLVEALKNQFDWEPPTTAPEPSVDAEAVQRGIDELERMIGGIDEEEKPQ